MKRLPILLLTLLFSLSTANCFQILNYIQFNSDGSLDLTWRFTVSASMVDRPGPGGSEQDKEDFSSQMSQAEAEIQRKLKGSVEKLKIQEINTEYDRGLMISFHVPDARKMPRLNDLPGEEKLPAFPVYDPDSHTLRVTFENEEAETVSADDSSPPSPDSSGDDSSQKDGTEDANSESNEMSNEESDNTEMDSQANQMGEELAKMILSSARYQVIISGAIPHKAEAVASETQELEIIPLGSNYLIDYPFMSSVVAEKRDVELVIHLKR